MREKNKTVARSAVSL